MRTFVAVGSNLGDRWAHLALAARALRAVPGVALLRASRVYDNEALSPRQARFLNAVLELETRWPPEALLTLLQEVERRAGRRRAARWAARTLDLDLLLYGERRLCTPRLVLPHPALGVRRFVLEPLAELCPDREVPGRAATVAALLRALPPGELRAVGGYPL